MSAEIDQNTNFDDNGDLISLSLDAFSDSSEAHEPAENGSAPEVEPQAEIELHAELQGDAGTDEQQSQSGGATESSEPLTGYELVADMMRRQDEVLSQLDDLNARIEAAIDEISASRKSEIEALESELAEADPQVARAA